MQPQWMKCFLNWREERSGVNNLIESGELKIENEIK